MLMNRTTPFMVPVDDANPAIIKNEALCSECGHCFAVCEEEIGVAAKYLLNQREAYQCIGCGQCSASCPEKAITGRPHSLHNASFLIIAGFASSTGTIKGVVRFISI